MDVSALHTLSSHGPRARRHASARRLVALAASALALPVIALGSAVPAAAAPPPTAVTDLGVHPDFDAISGAVTTIDGVHLNGATDTLHSVGEVYLYAVAGEQVAVDLVNDLHYTGPIEPGEISLVDPTGAVAFSETLTTDGTMQVLGGMFTSDVTGVWVLQIGDSLAEQAEAGRRSADLAWHLAVLSDADTAIPGRVWAEEWGFKQTPDGAGDQDLNLTDLEFVAVSPTGAHYAIGLFDYNGVDSAFAADSVGTGRAGEPLYLSIPQEISPERGSIDLAWSGVHEVGAGPGTGYRLFLEEPSADIPAEIEHWGDGRAGATWGVPRYVPPAFSDVAFTRDDASSNAGVLSGTTTQPGDLAIQIDTDGNGSYADAVDVVADAFASDAGEWTHAWDGLDAAGDAVPVTTEGITFRVVQENSSPIHFVRTDVEVSWGGLEVVQLTGPNVGDDTLFWDDSLFADVSDERFSTTPSLTSGEDGVSSTGGVHGWFGDDSGAFRRPNQNDGVTGSWGDRRVIDDWAAIQETTEAVVPLAALTELRIDKVVVDAIVADDALSAAVTWTIDVWNVGPVAATETVVTDTYPANVDPSTIEVVEGPMQGTFDTETGVWSIGSIEPGNTVSVTFAGTIPVTPGEPTTVVNTATVTSPDDPFVPGDECQANDDLESDTDQCDVVETPLDPPASHELQVDKGTVGDGRVVQGETIEYVLTALNAGNVTESDVVVTESPMRGLDTESVVVVGDPSHGTFDAETLTWAVGTLEPGESATITLSFEVLEEGGDGQAVHNQVVIENPENPYEPGDDCVPNDGADADTDQCDLVETPLDAVPPASLPETGLALGLPIGIAAAVLLAAGIALVVWRRRAGLAVDES